MNAALADAPERLNEDPYGEGWICEIELGEAGSLDALLDVYKRQLWVGKAGTFGLMFAYPAFLLGHGAASWQDPVRVVAWIAGIAGLTLAWIAAAAYVEPARAALAVGRQGRRDVVDSDTGVGR